MEYRIELTRADWADVYRRLRRKRRGKIDKMKTCMAIQDLRKSGNHLLLEKDLPEKLNKFFKGGSHPYLIIRPYRKARFHMLVVLEDQSTS